MTDEKQPEELIPTKIALPEKIKKLSLLFEKGINNDEILLTEMLKDEDAKEAINGLKRAALNIGISIVDVVPVIGDAISIGADIAKVTKFDLTPDASKAIAWSTELLELISGGYLPTHSIETAIQLKADVPRIKKGLKAIQKIWAAHQEAIESTAVIKAAQIFDTNVEGINYA